MLLCSVLLHSNIPFLCSSPNRTVLHGFLRLFKKSSIAPFFRLAMFSVVSLHQDYMRVCVCIYVCVRSCMHGLCMFVCMYYLDNHYSAVFSTAQIHCLQENLNDVKGIKNKTLVSTARVSRKNPLAAPADTKIPSNGFTFRPDSRQEPNSKKFNPS